VTKREAMEDDGRWRWEGRKEIEKGRKGCKYTPTVIIH
jgi:hypothetical protein